MAVVGDFLAGKALDALYSGVEKLIGNHQLFKSLSTDIKSKLDSLRPMIQQMEQRNQQSNCPEDPVLRDLRVLMEEGAVLIGNCFSDIRIWHAYKKYKYTNKLLKLNESLENQLKLLNVRVAVVVDKNSDTLHEIQEVVNRLDIVNQYEAGCALPELPPFIVGLDIPLKELKTKLFKDEVSRLVLTAPGGCGKTTLATKFCQGKDVKVKVDASRTCDGVFVTGFPELGAAVAMAISGQIVLWRRGCGRSAWIVVAAWLWRVWEDRGGCGAWWFWVVSGGCRRRLGSGWW